MMPKGYSFLSPSQKSIISPLTKAWIFYIFLSLIVLAFLWVVFVVQTSRFVYNANSLDKQIEQERLRTQTLQKELASVDDQFVRLRNVQEENQDMIEGLSNLFNLVPDQITINALDFNSKYLTIKGITPSKELYSFLLEAPLKAIFLESRADFYVLPSGWFNFVSVNKVSNSTSSKKNKESQ